MKLAVIGSRSFKDYELMESVLIRYKIEEIVSGGARGGRYFSADEYKKDNSRFDIELDKDFDLDVSGAPIRGR